MFNNNYLNIFYHKPCMSADDTDTVAVLATGDTSLVFTRPIAAKSFSDTQSNILNNVFVRRSKSPKL